MSHPSFPLDDFAVRIDVERVAGRVAVDALAILLPFDGAPGPDIALVPLLDIHTVAFAAEGWLPALRGRAVAGRPSAASLRGHALVIRVGGGFLDTDQVELARVDTSGGRWTVAFDITHLEASEATSSTRDLFVVLALETGDRPLRSVTLQFSGRLRGASGREQRLSAPVAPELTLEFAD